jgi:hypothetical protein
VGKWRGFGRAIFFSFSEYFPKSVIDSNFARAFFPDGQPIGHTITAGFAAFGPCAIVGIVNHVTYAGLQDSGPGNQYHHPNSQKLFAPTLRSWIAGPADLCYCLDCADCPSCFGWLHTRAPRRQGRSHGGPAVRVTTVPNPAFLAITIATTIRFRDARGSERRPCAMNSWRVTGKPEVVLKLAFMGGSAARRLSGVPSASRSCCDGFSTVELAILIGDSGNLVLSQLFRAQ